MVVVPPTMHRQWPLPFCGACRTLGTVDNGEFACWRQGHFFVAPGNNREKAGRKQKANEVMVAARFLQEYTK